MLEDQVKPFFKIFLIHLSVKISWEKLQTNMENVSKHLEKFKHSPGPQNLLVESFAV